MRQQEKTQQIQVVIEEEENDYDNIIESFILLITRIITVSQLQC